MVAGSNNFCTIEVLHALLPSLVLVFQLFGLNPNFHWQEKSTDRSIKTAKVLFHRVTKYYQSPTKEEFQRIQNAMSNHQEEIQARDKRNGIMRLSATFLARTSGKYKFPIQGKGPIFELAADIKNKSKKNKTAKLINDDSKVFPAKIDVWWMSFFATGDEKYLSKVLTYAMENPDKKKPLNSIVRKSARWSFKSNCRQHSTVNKFAKNALKDDKWSEIKDFLSECVDEPKDQKDRKPEK